jgi:hypothetical protein
MKSGGIRTTFLFRAGQLTQMPGRRVGECDGELLRILRAKLRPVSLESFGVQRCQILALVESLARQCLRQEYQIIHGTHLGGHLPPPRAAAAGRQQLIALSVNP